MINASSMLGCVPIAVIRSAQSGAKHLVNALFANFRAEVQETHPGSRERVARHVESEGEDP